jgi:hypothetical protein
MHGGYKNARSSVFGGKKIDGIINNRGKLEIIYIYIISSYSLIQE